MVNSAGDWTSARSSNLARHEQGSLLLLLFLTFSVLVANREKTTLHGGQSLSWSAEQGKKKSGSAPRPTLLVRRKKKKSRDASACLGATQVSVRLASVQGFLRLVG